MNEPVQHRLDHLLLPRGDTYIMETDNDILSSVSSLGLGRLLASVGVDSNSVSNFLDRDGDGSTSKRIADDDLGSDDGKYMDDVSDSELPAETEAEQRAREKEKMEEARYLRKAIESGKRIAAEGARVKQKEKEKEKRTETDEVKDVWPDFEKGKRLRMTEVFYETPEMRKGYEVDLSKKKRRKVDYDTICRSRFVADT